jgi:hypothetical protein
MSAINNSHKPVNIIDVILKKHQAKVYSKLMKKKKLPSSHSANLSKQSSAGDLKHHEENLDEQELHFKRNLTSGSRGRIHAVSQKKKIEVSDNNLNPNSTGNRFSMNGIDIDEFDEN